METYDSRGNAFERLHQLVLVFIYTLKAPNKQLDHAHISPLRVGKFTKQILFFGTDFCLI